MPKIEQRLSSGPLEVDQIEETMRPVFDNLTCFSINLITYSGREVFFQYLVGC